MSGALKSAVGAGSGRREEKSGAYPRSLSSLSVSSSKRAGADPSAPDAFVNGIMEGREWIWEGGSLREELAEKTQKTINTLVTQQRLEEKKLSLFQDFLNNL